MFVCLCVCYISDRENHSNFAIMPARAPSSLLRPSQSHSMQLNWGDAHAPCSAVIASRGLEHIEWNTCRSRKSERKRGPAAVRTSIGASPANWGCQTSPSQKPLSAVEFCLQTLKATRVRLLETIHERTMRSEPLALLRDTAVVPSSSASTETFLEEKTNASVRLWQSLAQVSGYVHVTREEFRAADRSTRQLLDGLATLSSLLTPAALVMSPRSAQLSASLPTASTAEREKRTRES